MRVLITGGAGFIGSHLVAYHLTQGDEVWAFDNLSTGQLKNLLTHPSLTFTQEDIITSPTLEKAVAWADRIYHLAAVVGQKKVIKEPVAVIEHNILGCSKILHYDKKPHCRVLIASSSEVYGPSGTSTFKEDAPITFPSGSVLQVNYSLAKFVNEAQALSYAQEKGVLCTIARLFNTTGPNQSAAYGMVVPNFVAQAQKNAPLTVYGDGSQTRSFCDIRDSVRALNALCNTEKSVGEIVNVGGDDEISILDLAKLVIEVAQSSSPIEFVPYDKAYGMPFTDVLRRKPNLEKLFALTDYRPDWDLRATIASMLKKNI